MKAKGGRWRFWIPIAILVIVSIGLYVRNWRYYLLHPSFTQQHDEVLVLPRSRTKNSVNVNGSISEQADLRKNDSSNLNVSDGIGTFNGTTAGFEDQQGSERKRTGTTTSNQPTSPVSDIPEQVEGGAFVHIGKTGGSTLTQYLRNACHSFMPKPCGVIPNETIVSKLITDYYHVPDFFRLPRKIHSFYLISLRDPFERTVSGFVFGHPTNAQTLGEGVEFWKKHPKRGGYFQPTCFATLEQWVENLGDGNFSDYDYPYKPIHVMQDNCTNFARAMLDAKVKRMSHLFFNYQKLQSMIPLTMTTAESNGTPSLYATRNEHLLHDFVRINQLLGEKQSDIVLNQKTRVRDVSNVTLPVTRELSDQGRQRLCRALEPEYRVYVDWLRHAKNLNHNDVIETLKYSRKQCPSLELLSSL